MTKCLLKKKKRAKPCNNSCWIEMRPIVHIEPFPSKFHVLNNILHDPIRQHQDIMQISLAFALFSSKRLHCCFCSSRHGLRIQVVVDVDGVGGCFMWMCVEGQTMMMTFLLHVLLLFNQLMQKTWLIKVHNHGLVVVVAVQLILDFYV